MIRVLRKKGEQVKFLGGKCSLFAVYIYTACRLVNADTPDFHNVVLGLLVRSHQALIPCHMRLHPGHQLTGAEGLRHIVVRSQAKPPDLVDIILLGRNHQNGNILLLPNLPAYFKAVHARQHDPE